MIKGYIFDYGGTLDTAGCHWGKLLWRAYQKHQVPVTEEQFRDAYVYAERTLGRNPIIQPHYNFHTTLSVKLRLEMEYLCQNGFWGADEAMFNEKHEAVLNELYAQVKETTRHSREVLEQLHQAYPMVLVSNFYGNIHEVLVEFGLDHLFQNVVESAVVGIRKPDHRIFALGVEKLGLKPEEVMVVGDSFYKDIEPAIKAGCKAAWFKGEGWTDATYDESIPDKVITDLAQLIEG